MHCILEAQTTSATKQGLRNHSKETPRTNSSSLAEGKNHREKKNARCPVCDILWFQSHETRLKCTKCFQWCCETCFCSNTCFLCAT